jgi:hypothetical protein
MDAVLAICAGVALAAACGFRVFLPLLAMSVAVASGTLTPGAGMEWVGSPPALIVLGVASALEVAAYYIPVVDHFLDTIASPAAVVAGTVAAGAMLPFGDQIHPAVKWAAALIAGGGAAGVIQAGTVTTRAVSGATTGTMGNPVVATVENVFSVVLSILAIVVPIIAAVVVVLVFAWVARAVGRWRRGRAARASRIEPA